MTNNKKVVSYKYDFINPTASENKKWESVPSFRGENQLIIYTRDFKYKSKDNLTGTNPWGLEAAIDENGQVINISDRVTIPENGFVISGNSIANTFIKENVELGSNVVIDKPNHCIVVTTDAIYSSMYTFKEKLSETLKRYEIAKENVYLIDYETIDKKLAALDDVYKQLLSLKSKYDNGNIKAYDKFLNIYKNSEGEFDVLYLLTSNSMAICSRNVWARPDDLTLEGIIEKLEVMKRCNMNGIYIESFYNGNIPGISSITETSEEVVSGNYGKYGNDYLYALISEAHARNIEVHAWVECFFVGEKSSQWKSRYPSSWHMINYNGETIQGTGDGNAELVENDFIWIDPANPECREYVISIYRELLTKYDFDGINVDYIRYPHGNYKLETSNGYSKYAMDEFKKINHLSGDVKQLVKDPSLYKLWTKYRCDKITELMRDIRNLVDEVKPTCLISMSVVPETEYAINNKMQDWVLWAQSKWIDITFPMAYYIGCSEVANATKKLVEFNNECAFSYPGIAPVYIGSAPILTAKQINTVFENGAEGWAIFQIDNILQSKQDQDVLQFGVNRCKCVQPHGNSSSLFKALADDLNNKANLYEKFHNVNVNDLSILCDSLIKISNYCKENEYDYLNQIKKLESAYQKSMFNCKALDKQIDYLIHILHVKNNIKRI